MNFGVRVRMFVCLIQKYAMGPKTVTMVRMKVTIVMPNVIQINAKLDVSKLQWAQPVNANMDMNIIRKLEFPIHGHYFQLTFGKFQNERKLKKNLLKNENFGQKITKKKLNFEEKNLLKK